MPATFFYKRASAAVIPAVSCLFLFFAPLPKSVHAQEAAAESVVISGEEIPSAYGAPPGISRTRFSPLLTAYVLPPWSFFFGELYEGDVFRHGPPDHIFTQEVEMGLPYRFGLAAEAGFERFNGGGGPSTGSIEARYALANWNKIPLNPTIFAEYKFGTGRILHEERPPEEEMANEETARRRHLNLEPFDEEAEMG